VSGASGFSWLSGRAEQLTLHDRACWRRGGGLFHHSLTLAGPRFANRVTERRRNAMAVGMDTDLLKILRSGGFSGTSDEAIERRPDAATAVLDRRQTKRLAGLALADQVSQRDARIRWSKRVSGSAA
jgi:hypothetical protein